MILLLIICTTITLNKFICLLKCNNLKKLLKSYLLGFDLILKSLKLLKILNQNFK